MINCSVNYNLLIERKDNIISKEHCREIFHNNQGKYILWVTAGGIIIIIKVIILIIKIAKYYPL